jgi:hypothetical protein
MMGYPSWAQAFGLAVELSRLIGWRHSVRRGLDDRAWHIRQLNQRVAPRVSMRGGS